MFSRNGYWLKKDIDGSVLSVFKVENDYDTWYYKDGEWVSTNTRFDMGNSDEYDKVSEQDALDALGIVEW